VIRLFTVAFLVFAVIPWEATAAAEPEVTVTLDAAPSEASVGETMRLEVRVHARGGRIEGLELSDLKKYPELEIISHQTVRPMQFSFGLGSGDQMESSLANVYVLYPTVAGTYEFTPAVAKVDGKIYRSAPLTLVVHPSAGGSTGSAGPVTEPGPSSDLSGATFDEQAFLRTVVEPSEAYIGQQVNVTVYLYTRLRLAPQTLVPSRPAMNGFWVHDEPITNLQFAMVPVNGVQFRAYVLQRSAAFPQRAGELTIGAPQVTFNAGMGGGSFFEPPQRVERTGVPVTVHVKPLPQPGPAGAAVGRFSLRAWLDRTAVATGDAVTLRADATGLGNVQDLSIDLPPIPGVRTLQPAIRDQAQLQGGVLSGTRSWEWILIAEVPGEHSIPPIQIQFFDPETEKYGSATTPALSFTSSGSANRSQTSIEPVDRQPAPDTAMFGPIRMYSALTRGNTPVRHQRWFAWLLAFPPLLFVLVLLGAAAARRRERRSATTGAVQRQLLRSADHALHANDPRLFYDRIVASIIHALDSRLGEPVGGLPHGQLRMRLIAQRFDDDLVQRVINELEGADFARFAASGVSEGEMVRCLQRTVAIVDRIQRSQGSV